MKDTNKKSFNQTSFMKPTKKKAKPIKVLSLHLASPIIISRVAQHVRLRKLLVIPHVA